MKVGDLVKSRRGATAIPVGTMGLVMRRESDLWDNGWVFIVLLFDGTRMRFSAKNLELVNESRAVNSTLNHRKGQKVTTQSQVG